MTPNRTRAEQIFRMIQNAVPIEDNLLAMIEQALDEADEAAFNRGVAWARERYFFR